MRMPVDNHIDIILDSRLYHGFQHFLLIFSCTCQIAPTIIPRFANTHGKADDFNFHLLHHGIDCCLRIKIRSGGICRTPIKAHALDLDFVSRCTISRTRAINTAMTIRVLAGLQLTVLAHRTHTSRSHCERGRNKTCSEHTQAKHFCTKSDCHISSDTPIFATKFRLLGLILHVISST